MVELIGSTLTVIVGNDNGAYHEVALHKFVTQSQNILIVSDTEVSTYLVLLYILSAHDYDNFQLVAQLGKHSEFRVGLEAWQHTTGVMVVEQFSA
jgi:hypothetical protein